MPVHDWTTVEAGVYHMMHGAWLVTIARALNNGVLPPGYYAMSEQVTATIGPDIVTLEHPPRPDPPPAAGAGVRSLDADRPAVGVLERAARATRTRPRRRLAVRHVSGHTVVAVIELVSPGNKAKKKDFRQFVEKAAAVIEVGVHLLVIDPFPPTARDPDGVHAAVWAEVAKPGRNRPRFTLPPGRPLTAASYAAGREVVAAVQPFAVGEPVPTMPLFLTADEEYVTVPLEATYAAAWLEVPKYWRDVLEG